MEGKLDSFLEKTARMDERIEHVRGHFRILLSVVLAAISGLVTMIFRNLLGGK